MELNQVRALQQVAPSKGGEVFTAQAAKNQEAITRYTAEEALLMKKARTFEKAYDDLNYRDDQFDLSNATLSISLAMLAITALTGKRRLLYLAYLLACFGILIGTAGLIGFPLHPDALVKFLS